MANIFKKVAMTKLRSNTFDLSHEKKMSMKMGKLVPSFIMDCIPGDVIKMSSSQLIRFAPMLAPVMHKVKAYTHYFFVPNRLVWSNWENFITGGEDGLDTSVFPTFNLDLAGDPGNLADYLGLPQNQGIQPAQQQAFSALPFAMYQLIYNEYYRDQNLINDIDTDLQDGDNEPLKASLALLRDRAWQHDYFTSALPWTQKGVEATIPLGTTAPLSFDPLVDNPNLLYDDTGANPPSIGNAPLQNIAGGLTADNTVTQQGLTLDNSRNLSVDLSTATAASINELRRAFRLQEWLEKNARGGSRYIESILSHFGVQSSDARLQRPEYLGGGAVDVSFSEVLQTSSTGSDVQQFTTPQGNMAGHGIAAGVNGGFKYRCEEHGYIIGILSVMPKTGYFQGVPKHWKKFDKFDFYWPEFANIGEQPIYNEEIYFQTDDIPALSGVFGYTPRYAEYKFMCNTIHGDFKTSLEYWHMARKFDTPPALNEQFISSDPTKRIFAVEDLQEDELYCQIYNKVSARRLMPVFGIPTI